MNFSDLEKYDYTLPEELVRKVPLEPRDSARLFVYDTKTDSVSFDIFRNLAFYLPKNSLVVLNNTRVLPARLHLKKDAGGKIEVFVLANRVADKEKIPVLLDRRGGVGQKIMFPNGDFFEIVGQEEEIFFVRLESQIDLTALLEQFGTTPIPHYLESEETIPEPLLRSRYQTIFAQDGASVAAPTASLHFTPEVFDDLEKNGIESVKIALDVGRGTFAPLTAKNFEDRKLHSEWITVTEETATRLNQAKQSHEPIVAVGTTVARTLETIGKNDTFTPFSGAIDTFLLPPHHFRSFEVLVTNFHLPKTSLMLLVDAFLQDKQSKRGVVELYQEAIREGFSFYSFGDSMLII